MYWLLNYKYIVICNIYNQYMITAKIHVVSASRNHFQGLNIFKIKVKEICCKNGLYHDRIFKFILYPIAHYE